MGEAFFWGLLLAAAAGTAVLLRFAVALWRESRRLSATVDEAVEKVALSCDRVRRAGEGLEERLARSERRMSEHRMSEMS